MFVPSENRSAASDQDAVERFLTAPSEVSFRELFRVEAPRLVAYFRVRGCGVELSEDLTQEVMFAVYQNARTLRSKELFRPWMYQIAKNALRRSHRDASRRVATTGVGREAEEVRVLESDPFLRSQFAEWMAWLNPEERQIMMLRYVDDLEHHEIATLLGMPLGTVQWKIFQIKRKLAARFGAGAP